jgi:hypothetical protein
MSHGAARADKTSRNRTFGSGSLGIISGAKLFFTRGSAPPRQPAQNAVEIANLPRKATNHQSSDWKSDAGEASPLR